MKKYLAVILVLSMVFALAACGSKSGGEETTAPEESTSEAVTEEIPEATATEAEEETETSEEAATPAESPATATESEQAEETEEETEPAKAPETPAEVLAAYNEAVNGACSAKAGFSKERYTDNANYNMGVALNTFKSLVEKFIGIGDKNKYSETVTKGQWADDTMHQYLRKSTLTEADIKNAACTKEGDLYVYTIDIKDGSSVGNKNSKQSLNAIDKCGLCVGNEDKNYFDHKSGPVIYDAIGGTFESAEIKESYNSAKAVAKVDADGKLVSLTVTFNISVDISVPVGNGTATGTTHVIYKDFKY
ncbi:MAG: hypothetical protein IKS39_11570 [Clostridia bacterium]|nr:hypothetical protein [Clostridia bacterium]